MARVTKITTGVMGDTCGDIDPSTYADKLLAALEDAYPGAAITIPVRLNLAGSVPHELQTSVEVEGDEFGEAERAEVENVDAIAERVFADMCANA